MSRLIAGLAALALMGAATLPLQANAAERLGVTNTSMELSAQRHWRHWHHRWGWGPRRHWVWGPRYHRWHRWGYWRPRYHRWGYWGPRYHYGYYGYPYRYGYGYGYYRPRPFVAFGAGPFGFRVF